MLRFQSALPTLLLAMTLTACGGAAPEPQPVDTGGPVRGELQPAAVIKPDVAAVFTSTGKPDANFKLTSSDFAEGVRLGEAFIYNSFGCSGQNRSPQLAWAGAPAGTKSFAVLMYDPDAPTGSGFWHWLAYNIPASANGLPQGAGTVAGAELPTGSRQGRSDFGSADYGGPCPPPGSGEHRYYFRVHALGVEKLDLPAEASAALIGFNINANTLATAQLIGVYSR
jgi:hypothetical protein